MPLETSFVRKAISERSPLWAVMIERDIYIYIYIYIYLLAMQAKLAAKFGSFGELM